MRLTIVAFGTRGDVQPAIALGKGLQAAGYAVQIAAALTMRGWVQSHGLDYAPLSVDIHALMNSEGGQAWVESGRNQFNEIRHMKHLLHEHGWPAIQEMWALCQQTDVMISGFTSMTFVQSLCERLNKPHIMALLQPVHTTQDGRAIVTPFIASRPSRINKLAGWIFEVMVWWLTSSLTNRLRETIGLAPTRRKAMFAALKSTPTLYGFSPRVVPRPADWPESVCITGYWFLDDEDDWSPPQDLLDFLDSGAPPIYLGFGSMSNRNPEQTVQMMLDALAQTGQRGIIASGWAGLVPQDLPESVYVLDSAPHSWLFPRMAGVVHHGGAGTTAAALRAGVPSTIIPHFTDQPYWARRVYELGVGAKPIPRHKLTADKLTGAIHTLVTDKATQQRAAALGEQIRAEDGVANAAQQIQQILSV